MNRNTEETSTPNPSIDFVSLYFWFLIFVSSRPWGESIVICEGWNFSTSINFFNSVTASKSASFHAPLLISRKVGSTPSYFAINSIPMKDVDTCEIMGAQWISSPRAFDGRYNYEKMAYVCLVE